MKRLIIIAILLIHLAGCSRKPLPQSTAEDILEATFRYQFTKNASSLQQKAKVYFLAVSISETYQDPSDKFVTRFTGNVPRVARWSESIFTAAEGVRDKITGERGLIFSVGKIRSLSDETAEVDGGYYEGTENSSRSTYYLRKTLTGWKVDREVMYRISQNHPVHEIDLTTPFVTHSANAVCFKLWPLKKSRLHLGSYSVGSRAGSLGPPRWLRRAQRSLSTLEPFAGFLVLRSLRCLL